MLYQVGAVTLDTRPFNVDAVQRRASADFATKALVGRLAGLEFMGEGEEEIRLTGQILPSRIGGLTSVEALHAVRRTGSSIPVMRGDGRMFGWFVIAEIEEDHRDLERNGVGFAVRYSVRLVKSEPERAASDLIGGLLSIFGVFGRG